MGAQLILGAQQILMVLGAQGARGAQTMNCTIAPDPITQIWLIPQITLIKENKGF